MCLSILAVPPAPTSAEATVIKQPPGKTVVQVSWEPDKDGVVPVSYNLDLTLLSNLGYSLFLNVPGVSTSVEASESCGSLCMVISSLAMCVLGVSAWYCVCLWVLVGACVTVYVTFDQFPNCN